MPYRGGDYQELENQGQELLSELNELLRENIEKEEQLQKASDRVQEEEQLRKRLEKILNDMTAVEVNNIHNISQEASQDVTQDVHVEVTQETRQQLEFLSEQLSDAVDSSIQESKFPEPPSDFSDADRVISWLQKIDNILSTADDLSQKTKKLKPTVTGLLAAFGL